MRKKTINKITFGSLDTPVIEIFSNQRYKDYYVRGQICELPVCLGNERRKEEWARVNYRFMILALVNDMYQKEIGEDDSFCLEFGKFFKNTEREFLETQSNYLAKEIREISKRSSEGTLENLKHSTLVIDLKEANIVENAYLNQSVKAKKDIILLDLDIVLNKIEIQTPGFGEETETRLRRIYSLPAGISHGQGEASTHPVMGWFSNLHELLYFWFDYNYLDRKTYYLFLTDVGLVANDWIAGERIINAHVELLNRLQEGIGDRTYPLTNFCFKFLDDLIDDLTAENRITKCQFCGGLFKYIREKKYCSFRSEGKNCGKSARNKRYYEKHKDEILPKARKSTEELRAFYKKMGVKK